MKKWVFIIAFFVSVVLTGAFIVYADTWHGEDYGAGTVNSVRFVCDITPGETTSNYDLSVGVSNSKEIVIDALYVVDSSGVKTKYGGSSLFTENFNSVTYYYLLDGLVIDNTVDVAYFSISFRHPFNDYTTVYNLNSTMHYEVEPTPIITPDIEEPEPEEPTPEITPEITPDIEEPEPEEPTPEITPDPTPTNTPTPTPTPGPILELNAFVTSKDAVAQYRTGGCTPIRSTIEFYEVDTSADILTKVNSEEFLSGTGTMRNTMIPGKVYRYKLTYIFQRDSVQFEKYLWSDDLTIIDQELEDYRSNKKITNFRTLMLYVWEDVMKLEIPIEGFHISFQSLFIWVMVAVVLIWFIKKYNR